MLQAVSGERPFYQATGDEEAVFRGAYQAKLPILLKGPTGCGKTRFVEAMAHDLKRQLITVACHDDLSAADLVGRFLLRDGETVWQDGPLTRAVREGAICYLDEIVEARSDTLVVLHPLSDHRRRLPIERLNEEVAAAPGFGLVVSYNPGYQSVLKELKPSTRQRMVALRFDYPDAEKERAILLRETGVTPEIADRLVALAGAIRRQEDAGLREAASTRTMVSASRLIHEGVAPLAAVQAAMVQSLSDDPEIETAILEIARAIFR